MTYLSKKLYYEFPFHYNAKSVFEKRADYYVALERAIAYPEGGGQLGDKGVIIFQEHSFPFLETKKVAGRGRTVIRSDFPVINVEGEVQIKLAPEHYDILSETGDVTVIVDNAAVEIKRKGKSKGLERIYYELQNLNVSPFQAKFKEEVLW